MYIFRVETGVGIMSAGKLRRATAAPDEGGRGHKKKRKKSKNNKICVCARWVGGRGLFFLRMRIILSIRIVHSDVRGCANDTNLLSLYHTNFVYFLKRILHLLTLIFRFDFHIFYVHFIFYFIGFFTWFFSRLHGSSAKTGW